MTRVYICITIIIMIVALMGCNNFTATDLNPFFLTLNEPTITTTPIQGAPTHKIRDAWIFTQDQELGPIELPITLPILDDAEVTEFEIFPGIRQNGQEFVPIINPYLQSTKFSIASEPGETYVEDLNFEYFDNVVFELTEDFTGNHPFTLENDDFEGSTFTVESDPEDPNNSVAVMRVDTDNPVVEVFSTSVFLPEDFNNNAYLEIDYSNNAPLTIGIMNISNVNVPEYIILLNNREDRNKLYLDIGNIISGATVGQFSILFNLSINGTGLSEGEAIIDNVKLLHL